MGRGDRVGAGRGRETTRKLGTASAPVATLVVAVHVGHVRSVTPGVAARSENCAPPRAGPRSFRRRRLAPTARRGFSFWTNVGEQPEHDDERRWVRARGTRHRIFSRVTPMAALLRSWARRALRLARDMQDVSPVSAANEVVTSFARAEDVDRGWHAWSDEPHGGTSRATLSWVPRAEGMGDAGDDDVGAMVLEGSSPSRVRVHVSRVVPSPPSSASVGTASPARARPVSCPSSRTAPLTSPTYTR